ncbi:MAG: CBS domain-containing protein [Anaerolineae bacterium]|nr:CBS domain-containing protein [Anaerolineae bacterium]
MLVRERMTPVVITVTPDMPVTEALNLMNEKAIRRFPVIDGGKMVGIVSKEDLLRASPSAATTLSIHEIGYLLSKLTVSRVMTHEVVTVDVNAPLEEAARIMRDHDVSGLPVMDKGYLVGIVTESDIFATLLEMMGARENGIRLTLEVANKPGVLGEITGQIAALGGDIVSLGTFYGEDRAHGVVTIKVCGVVQEVLLAALADVAVRVVDVRETDADAGACTC